MSSSLESDPILVSYHDSIVRRSNLKTLDQRNWLDDNIINFAFEYLQYGSKTAEINDNRIQFITPPVIQLLKMTDDSFAGDLLQSIDFGEKQFLIVPINDSTRATTIGGSHWSVLILSVQNKILYHFDSLSSVNDQTAREIQGKFRLFFHQDVPVLKCHCPQQRNGYDCGLYLITFVEEFCQFLDSSAEVKKVAEEKLLFEQFGQSLHRVITSDYINQRRQNWKTLIESMSKNLV